MNLTRDLSFLLIALTCSCSSIEPVDMTLARDEADVGARIVAEALARGRAYDMLTELCTVAPKRLAGSAGAERAVRWAEERMRAEGLENVRREPCVVPRWVRASVETLVRADTGDRLAITALGGSVATPPGGLVAGVVEVRTFEELRALGNGARGKIVFFARPMDPALVDTFAAYGGAVDQRSRGAVEAARAGAVGAIVRSMTTALDDHPHTGSMRYEESVVQVPAAAISTRDAEKLSAWLRQDPNLGLRLELDCKTLPDVPSWNVVGELRGRTRPEEIVLIGGHLDAWESGDGAHDDGAGCVQTLEAVRILRTLDLRPARTVRVCFFMNEENGLAGGRAYRETHADELGRHVLALESDRGGFTPRAIGTDANATAFAYLSRAASLLAASGADRIVEGGGGSDISPLAQDGVILCELLPDPQRYFDFHHAATDVLESVNPRELALGAAAIATFAWYVAELPEDLPRNRLP